MVECIHLGQCGFRLKINEVIVYIDSYLLDRIESSMEPLQIIELN